MTLASREKRLKPVSTKCRLQTAVDLSGGSRPSDKGGRGRSSRSLDKGGPGLPKNCFRSFEPQFALKIRVWGRVPPRPLP